MSEQRAQGYYWIRHIRPDAPWQPAEYLGDGCWITIDCDGVVSEWTIAWIGPRITPPEIANAP